MSTILPRLHFSLLVLAQNKSGRILQSCQIYGNSLANRQKNDSDARFSGGKILLNILKNYYN